MATYKSSSLYRNTPLNSKYLENYQPPFVVTPQNVKRMTLVSKYNHRPDLLAYDLYGDAGLWWVFTLYNRNAIVDPIYDFVTGLEINVPDVGSITGV
jgi:hypothetical protein